MRLQSEAFKNPLKPQLRSLPSFLGFQCVFRKQWKYSMVPRACHQLRRWLRRGWIAARKFRAVLSSSDTPRLLELTTEILDQAASFIEVFVVRARLFAVGFCGNDWLYFGVARGLDHSLVGVVGLVGKQRVSPKPRQKRVGTLEIMRLSGREMEAGRRGISLGNYLTPAPIWVANGGVEVGETKGRFSRLSYRYFGARPLTEDGIMKSPAVGTVNARVGYRFDHGWKFNVDAFNILNSAIDYHVR